jgi:hypothetical protein
MVPVPYRHGQPGLRGGGAQAAEGVPVAAESLDELSPVAV